MLVLTERLLPQGAAPVLVLAPHVRAEVARGVVGLVADGTLEGPFSPVQTAVDVEVAAAPVVLVALLALEPFFNVRSFRHVSRLRLFGAGSLPTPPPLLPPVLSLARACPSIFVSILYITLSSFVNNNCYLLLPIFTNIVCRLTLLALVDKHWYWIFQIFAEVSRFLTLRILAKDSFYLIFAILAQNNFYLIFAILANFGWW